MRLLESRIVNATGCDYNAQTEKTSYINPTSVYVFTPTYKTQTILSPKNSAGVNVYWDYDGYFAYLSRHGQPTGGVNTGTFHAGQTYYAISMAINNDCLDVPLTKQFYAMLCRPGNTKSLAILNVKHN